MQGIRARALGQFVALAVGLAVVGCGNSAGSRATTSTGGGGKTSGGSGGAGGTSTASTSTASTGTDGAGGASFGYGSGTWTVQGVETCTSDQPMQVMCSDGSVDSPGGYEIYSSVVCDNGAASNGILVFGQKKTPAAGTYPVYAVKSQDDYANTPLGQVAVEVNYWYNNDIQTVWAQSGTVTVKAKGAGTEFSFTGLDATNFSMFGSSITIGGDFACPPFP